MKYEGIDFNSEWVASMKEDEFLKVANEEGHNHWYEGDKKRSDKLKEVHALAVQKEGKEVVEIYHEIKKVADDNSSIETQG